MTDSRRKRHSRGALDDPNMIWQTYRACRQRGEDTMANETLYKYVELWLYSSSHMSQNIRFRLEPHLLPSLAFEETALEWLLQQRPHGVLTALINLLLHYYSSISGQGTQKVFGGGATAPVSEQLPVLTRALHKITCCNENLSTVSNSRLFKISADIYEAALSTIISRVVESEDTIKLLLETMGNCVAILHVLVDPKHYWVTALSTNQPSVDNTAIESKPVTQDILKMINETCTSLSTVLGNSLETEYQTLLLETLHLLGAILSGTETNSQLAVMVISDTFLYSLLEPRESCSPLQVLTLRVAIRMIHVMHCWVPEESLTNMDIRVVISILLNILAPRWKLEGELLPPHSELVISILDSFSVLCNPPFNSAELKEILVDIAVMEKIAEVLNTMRDEAKKHPDMGVRLCCSVLRAYGHLLHQSSLGQEAFEQRVGYDRLRKLLTGIAVPTKEILMEGLNIAIEDDFQMPKVDHTTIHNPPMVAMLLRWAPCLPSSLCSWLVSQIFELCTFAIHNRQICCTYGLLRVVVEVLATSQCSDSYIGSAVEDQLIQLVEILGSHSIVAAELKQIIGALRTTEDKQLPTYYYRLQQALCSMAQNKEGVTPLYYFDMRQPLSHISISDLKSWPSTGGFTFHAWVCLNAPSSLGRSIEYVEIGTERIRCRRMLYSFYTSHDTGFEAFFTENMNFVVATRSKKEFNAYIVYQAMFRSSEWHSVCIVHQLSKKLFSKEDVHIYIDGNLIDQIALKAIGLIDKRYQYCYIGSNLISSNTLQRKTPSTLSRLDEHQDDDSDFEVSDNPTGFTSMSENGISTIPSSEIEERWGMATHLSGLLSSICVFSEALSPNSIKTLFQYGPNKLSLFQPNCSYTSDLANKVLVYYHPKACRDGHCINLSPQFTSEPKLYGTFYGQPYVTWDVKNVLSSLGGVELLFPILEQVGIPLKQLDLKGNQMLIDDQELSSVFNSKEGAAAFLFLLVAMLDGCSTNQEVFFLRQGPATVGSLLQKVSPELLTQQFLAAVQRLCELFNNSDQENFIDIEKYILFNFNIWSRPDISVRTEHIQYISTLIQAKPELYRSLFGVQFMLDVIRVYYSSMGNTRIATQPEVTSLSEEDLQLMRSALYSITKLYIMKDVSKDEVEAILNFLASCQDLVVLEELLRFLYNALTNAPSHDILGHILWTNGLLLLVLIQADSSNVRLLAIKIIAYLLKQYENTRTGPIYTCIESGTLAAAVCQMAHYEVPSNIVLALLELCTSKSNDYTDYISNMNLYLAVLQLLRGASLVIRHTICHQTISLLHLNPGHVDEIASHPGWDSLFLWLLCTPHKPKEEKETPTGDQPDQFNNSTPPKATPPNWLDLSNEDDDACRTFAVVTETIGYILWHLSKKENQIWLTWGCLFASLDLFSKQHCLIFPIYIIKQRLFSLLINALSLEAKTNTVSNQLVGFILQSTQLFETFIIESYPDCLQSSEVCEIEESTDTLRECSHSVQLHINMQSCCEELLSQYLDMLNSIQLFTSSCKESDELSIVQSVIRILLACMGSGDPNYYLKASTRLLSIVQYGSIDKQDVYFVLKHISSLIKKSKTDPIDPDHIQHIAAVVREIFIKYDKMLNISTHLPNLPDFTNSPNFRQEFIDYTSQDEWTEYHEKTLVLKANNYNIVLFPWLSSCAAHRKEGLNLYLENEQKRRSSICRDLQGYQEQVLQPHFELREEEYKRQKSIDNLMQNELLSILTRWKCFRKFYTGERGAWSNRTLDPYLWGLSRTENFSRMRMKLQRLYTSNNHSDAAKLRDQLQEGNITRVTEDDKSLLAKAARTTDISYEEEDQLSTELLQLEETEMNKPNEEEEKEKVIRTEKCDIIMLMECIPGKIEITNKHIFFFADQLQEKRELILWYTPEFKVALADLREIHSRRYNMSRTALEIFLVDQTNYFLNFSSRKIVQRVYGSILSLRPPNLNRVGINKPSKLLHTAGLIEKWKKREISNFDYLMQLNTIAGRTYNDLNQYPIFPWVLSDYTSNELDLTDPKVYRDFSRPMGAQNPKNRENLRIKYQELQDPILGSFHYGSHYSNAAGVLHYLIRLEPFTSLHIELQSGRFDVADRQYLSIPSTWANVYNGSSDVKELTPEFFFLPEFLTNINNFNLGVRLHTGKPIDNVELPRWASSPDDFIQKHKQALESEYVSQHLHEWIDLIFGYKQSGPEAEKALNVFLKYSYEENVNLDDMKDERDRKRVEAMINNFGQTPTKLFNEPHPKRWTVEQAKKNPGRGYLVGGRKSQVNLLEKLNKLKLYSVDVSVSTDSSNYDPVVFVGTPTIQTRALLVSGNPEQLVTITNSGLLNVHGWLPFSNARSRPFTFNFDPNTHFDKTRWLRVGAPFAQDMTISPHNFVLSQNNKLLVTGGHWDNSFRVFSVDKSKLIERIDHHNDIVSCMALDKAGTGEHLVTGSRDTTCVVWKFKNDELSKLPLVTLYGHDSEVLCIDISTELDMVVSGAKDGSCIIHTVRGGHYVHTLRPRGRHLCEIKHVLISSHGKIIVYSQGPQGKSRPLALPPCVHLYTVNGKLLQEKELAEPVNSIVIVDKYIITGNKKGFLTFRDLTTLRQLTSLNLLECIRCISVVLDHQSKVCTHLLVGLQNGKLIIVSVKD